MNTNSINITMNEEEEDIKNTNLQLLVWFSQGTLIGLMGWILSLELRKGLGNIWYRCDSYGKRSIQFSNLINFMKKSLEINNQVDFWYYKNWDLNFIVTSTYSGLTYMTLKNGIMNLTNYINH